MTASDSDCSIDWLASDNEDSGASESDSGRPSTVELDSPKPEPESSQSTLPQLRTTANPPCDRASSDATERQERSLQREPQSTPTCRSGHKRPCSQGAPECEPKQLREEQTAETDKLLHRKCRELQCYILPLTSILNGLQSGRYRERLSSFQESVAMDRIRRILGVLQNPCSGERYINIILKVEVMLKTWFPNVKPEDQPTGDHGQESTPSKRQKISPATVTPSVSTSIPVSLRAQAPNSSDSKARAAGEAVHSATSLKWLHTSPICSAAEETGAQPPRNRAAPGRRAVTQDDAVSSSTDPDPAQERAPDPKLRPPPPHSFHPSGKISAPCLERLLKSTESIVSRRGVGGDVESGWS
ncbi:hypothetical protein GJAV_G00250790 [Gymnothorax javanicus]|nr:hypothetical protein GJAV_G00250790 [Gymnothorax javanicus]